MENPNPMPSAAPVPPIAPKKGLGTGAKIGIGCGVIVLLGIIASIIGLVILAPKMKDFADDMQKNPARAAANMMVKMSAGNIEMVAEDDENKRYTVKETRSGKLTTVYLDEKTKTPLTVEGDFSAIPAPAAADALPAPAPAPEEP